MVLIEETACMQVCSQCVCMYLFMTMIYLLFQRLFTSRTEIVVFVINTGVVTCKSLCGNIFIITRFNLEKKPVKPYMEAFTFPSTESLSFWIVMKSFEKGALGITSYKYISLQESEVSSNSPVKKEPLSLFSFGLEDFLRLSQFGSALCLLLFLTTESYYMQNLF